MNQNTMGGAARIGREKILRVCNNAEGWAV